MLFCARARERERERDRSQSQCVVFDRLQTEFARARQRRFSCSDTGNQTRNSTAGSREQCWKCSLTIASGVRLSRPSGVAGVGTIELEEAEADVEAIAEAISKGLLRASWPTKLGENGCQFLFLSILYRGHM